MTKNEFLNKLKLIKLFLSLLFISIILKFPANKNISFYNGKKLLKIFDFYLSEY